MELESMLKKANILPDIKRIAITCVDPNYPAKSLGTGFDDVNVVYSDNEHELKGHVQLVGEEFVQLILKYDKENNTFVEISPEEAHTSLGYGIVQLAYRESDQTLVIGIPGDAYAFNPDGAGFAFANPNHITPDVSEKLLRSIIEYSGKVEEIVVMLHPDCGLYANNAGVVDEKISENARQLNQSGDDFMESSYQRTEHSDKERGFEKIQKIANSYGISKVKAVAPDYRQRTPGIVNALK